jgi:6-phosphogluconolactonase
VAAARSSPPQAWSYLIDRTSGSLTPIGTGPLAESLPYIAFDATGRWLLGASYGGNLVCVNRVSDDGRVGAPLQIVSTARNAHAIRADNTNRFVFVPHLGTDQVFQFRFDDKTGRLTANTPPLVQLEAGCGPPPSPSSVAIPPAGVRTGSRSSPSRLHFASESISSFVVRTNPAGSSSCPPSASSA